MRINLLQWGFPFNRDVSGSSDGGIDVTKEIGSFLYFLQF